MSTVPRKKRRKRLVLRDIDWKTYAQLDRVFAEGSRVRLTYDHGKLEIMSPSIHHDGTADFLGILVAILTEEMNLPCLGGGSVTLKRRGANRGLEPDRCYWIAGESAVRGKKKLDLRVDPAPDLALEVDVTSSSLDRMAIYAALGVGEVWRVEDDILTFQILSGGNYSQATHSGIFSFVTPADLMHFLARRSSDDDTSLRREFRKWVSHQLAPHSKP